MRKMGIYTKSICPKHHALSIFNYTDKLSIEFLKSILKALCLVS